ncbi:TIGR03619 family F420-dependent LLM class oxidoreductase [Haloarchaeobius sp. DFWS5]|uniref:TIGR03619 family F420-dependent LLM class oxidoreductase n=1 Tax=Haloarchaeobius sp. DFWS5 TaxID=3446114 RepID=UPI003EBE5708
MSEDTVEFGVMLSATSNSYGLTDEESPGVFRELATTAENSGFDVVLAGDHIAYPSEIPTEYGYSSSGEPPFDTTTSVYDVFQVFAHLAAVTDDIRFGTNVVAVPYRHPIVLAKNALTLDSLSGGRFDFGLAPGWLKTEFDALDVPFDERGSRTDEFLELFTRACEEGELSFEGEHHSFGEMGFHPSPSSEIPLWIGGRSGATFRRIAQFGHGWSTLWEKPDEVGSARDRIMNAWADFEREGEPEIGLLRPMHVAEDGSGPSGKILTGTPESVVEDVQSYVDAGATRIIVDFFSTDIDDQVEQLERIGEHVIPAFR